MLQSIDGLTSLVSLHHSCQLPTEPLLDRVRAKLDTDDSYLLLLQTFIFDAFLRPMVSLTRARM